MRTSRNTFEVLGDGTFFGMTGLGVAPRRALLSGTPTAQLLAQDHDYLVKGSNSGLPEHTKLVARACSYLQKLFRRYKSKHSPLPEIF
jgi:hypothetical protein